MVRVTGSLISGMRLFEKQVVRQSSNGLISLTSLPSANHSQIRRGSHLILIFGAVIVILTNHAN